MKYIDMHCDTISEIWYSRLRGENYDLEDCPCMINLRKLRKGDCLCQNLGLFVNLHRQSDFRGSFRGPAPTGTPASLSGSDAPGASAAGKIAPMPSAPGHPEYLDPWFTVSELLKTAEDELALHRTEITKVTTGTEIHKALDEGKMCALLTVEEGGACEGSLEHLKTLYDAGVRMMTLTWNYENELAFPNIPNYDDYYHFKPAESGDGLKKRGFEFLEAMQDMGMIVDVSHLSDGGFYDVAKTVKGPFVASHSNARAVCGCNRNLTDDMIRILAEHGGVTGLNFEPSFVEPVEHPDNAPEKIAAHALHLKKVGGIDCIGLGSDFDGIGGNLIVDGADKLGILADALKKAGFTESEVEKIFYRNVLRVYDEVLG